MNGRYKTALFIVMTIVMCFTTVQTGHAVLSSASTTDDPTALDPNGFPLWYQDSNGIALAPCLTQSPAGNLCIVLPDAFFNPADSLVFPSNFPGEFFYWIAEPDFTLTDTAGAVIRIRFALEGSFAGGAPLENDQVVFQRKRFRVNVPPGGTITIKHPYGTDTFTDGAAPDKSAPDQDGVINVTFDEPVNLIAGNFQSAVTANLIGPFLVAANPAPQSGFVGDFVIPQTVTGGPQRQNVEISGAVNLSTELWLVSGQMAITQLAVNSATYSRTTTSGEVNISANSSQSAVVNVGGDPLFPTPVSLGPGNAGVFVGSFPVDPALLGPPQPSLTLTASEPPAADSVLSVKLVDVVQVSLAEFDTATQTLTVNASSSDQGSPAPTLTAQGFGDLVAGSLTVPVTGAAPSSVTVASSAGGSATLAVTQVNSGPVVPEALTIAVAKFMTKPAKWNIKGKSTLKKNTANTMTIHLGDANGPVIGTKKPNRAGVFSFMLKKTPLDLTPDVVNNTVTIVSDNGAAVSGTVIIR